MISVIAVAFLEKIAKLTPPWVNDAPSGSAFPVSAVRLIRVIVKS